MYLSEEMDAGDIIFTCSTPIDACETAGLLHDRLAGMGAALLLTTLEAIEKGVAPRTKQTHTQATYAPLLTKEEGRINWTLSAQAIYNRFRGLAPWPGTLTLIDGKQLLIGEMALLAVPTSEPPGTVLKSDRELVVATGKGQLYLLEVQLEGKKRMPVDAFLRGHPIPVGTVLP